MEHGESCTCPLHFDSTAQSLEELSFSRGIWSAAIDGEVNKVKTFLSSSVHPDVRDSSGYTALHYAARNGHLSVCTILISAGATVNAQTPGGVTALHRACYSGHTEVVLELLKSGADPIIKDQDEMTSLHKACERGHSDIIRLLLDQTENVSDLVAQRNKRGQTASDLIPVTDNASRTLLESRTGKCTTLDHLEL